MCNPAGKSHDPQRNEESLGADNERLCSSGPQMTSARSPRGPLRGPTVAGAAGMSSWMGMSLVMGTACEGMRNAVTLT